METERASFRPPLSACFRLPSENCVAEVQPEGEGLKTLRDVGSGDCCLCKLDELFGEEGG